MKSVRLDAALHAEIRRLEKSERRLVGEAIARAQENFGQTHLHSGVGLRKLVKHYYEARVGLNLRLVFRDTGEFLSFELLGDHARVRRFLHRH